jgi:hypothetical protein
LVVILFCSAAVIEVITELLSSSRRSQLGIHDSADTLSSVEGYKLFESGFPPVSMQTPNHSIISELLKSINAAAELCKTKLPDQIDVTQNLQALAGESLAPISPDDNSQKEDDSNNQDPKLQLTKTLQNADHFHRKRRIVQLNSSDDESDQNYSTKFTPTRSTLELECTRLDRKTGTLFVLM